MRKSRSAILEELNRSPGDWAIRIEAIEAALRDSDPDGARQLVREDPSSDPVPPEIQVRLHTLLTRGVAPEAEVEESSDRDEAPEAGPVLDSEGNGKEEQRIAKGKESIAPGQGIEEQGIDEESEREDREAQSRGAETPADENREGEASGKAVAPSKTDPVVSSRSTWESNEKGGLGALLEVEAVPERKKKISRVAKRRGGEKAPKVDFQAAIDRWQSYEGDLNLVEAEYVPPVERSFARERLSSLSTALFVHLILFVLIGLVAVTVPLPSPPRLIVSVVPETESQIVAPPPMKPSEEIKPAAAAARSLDVVTSVENSSFSLPDVDDMDNELVAALLPGIQPVGNGMSFVTEATEATNVNFFGISGGGRKIVFIIDATPKMLVDEKGGMFAYDNVKNEVGIMLANLNRGTHFNILLYQGKRLIPFREKLVPGLPSNIRYAIEWLDPLNRDYEQLGLPNQWGESLEVEELGEMPLQSIDLAHYTKAIQKAMEWETSTIFCITSGYERMARSPTPEMRKMMEENPPEPGTPGQFDPAEMKAWREALAETREWLVKENAARREKGISPKVVIDFNQLVRERTGATPPRRRGGTPATGGADLPRLAPVTPEDVEEQIEEMVKRTYTTPGLEEPSVHMVLFLGEGERIREEEDHFRRVTRKNRGKLKVLRGLSALENVTEN